MNAIQVIHPYKFLGLWVFDDEGSDLRRCMGPFVAQGSIMSQSSTPLRKRLNNATFVL